MVLKKVGDAIVRGIFCPVVGFELCNYVLLTFVFRLCLYFILGSGSAIEWFPSLWWYVWNFFCVYVVMLGIFFCLQSNPNLLAESWFLLFLNVELLVGRGILHGSGWFCLRFITLLSFMFSLLFLIADCRCFSLSLLLLISTIWGISLMSGT